MLRLSLFFQVFRDTESSQALSVKGLANRLVPVRCSELSLFLAYPNEFEPLFGLERTTVCVDQRRNTTFRHGFTPSEPRALSVSHFCEAACDKCKAGPFIGVTPLFTPISGIPTGAFVSFVIEPTEN